MSFQVTMIGMKCLIHCMNPVENYKFDDNTIKNHFKYLILREKGKSESISREMVRKLMIDRNVSSKNNDGYIYKFKLRPAFSKNRTYSVGMREKCK